MFEDLSDDVAFDFVEIVLYLHGIGVEREKAGRCGGCFRRQGIGNGDGGFRPDGFVVHILDLQVVDLHCISDAQGDGAFEDVFEFAEIARITVIQEHLLRGGGECVGPVVVAVFVQEVGGGQLQIFAHFTQGRHIEADDIETVIQVLAECAAFDKGFEVFVGGADDADIDGLLGRVADTAHGFFLNRAQEFHLHGKGQVGHFVQK